MSTTDYLAPLSASELHILGEKFHRAAVKSSISTADMNEMAYEPETHIMIVEVYDDTWDERESRKVRFQVGDPDNGPFTSTYTAANEAEAAAWVAKNYGPVADAMEYPDSDGKIITLYIVIDA